MPDPKKNFKPKYKKKAEPQERAAKTGAQTTKYQNSASKRNNPAREEKNCLGAVLLDTRSIQKYVFASNELKTNVGASYIVAKIFSEVMKDDILPAVTPSGNVSVNWEKIAEPQIKKDKYLDCEIGYIGGGSMLIFVRGVDKDGVHRKCKHIVRKWSETLLLAAPGLKTGAAIVDEINLDALNFRDMIQPLYDELKKNQNMVMPNVDLPYTGLTRECTVSGKTADCTDNSGKGARKVSAEVLSKLNAYKNAREEMDKQMLPELAKGYYQYAFADDLNNLGFARGESYMCVVHVDGNNMGVKFSACRTLAEHNKLSIKVEQTVKTAFKKLVQYIIDNYSKLGEWGLDAKALKAEDGTPLLPIRPIILGGDDVTFVCPGRMGLEFTRRFMEYVNESVIIDDNSKKEMERFSGKKISGRLSCCAGVAIVPAKYPFFRAYGLAEKLCDSAKKKSRVKDDSWMDFAVLHGEMTPELDQLLKYEYSAPMGSLHYGPYSIEGGIENPHSINALLALKEMISPYSSNGEGKAQENRAAENKIKKLREVLCSDVNTQNVYLEHSPAVVKILQKINGRAAVTADGLWDNGSTRFIDAIEIIDFLPKAAKEVQK